MPVMKIRFAGALAALAAIVASSAVHALDERNVTIETRPGVTLGMVVVRPDAAPVAGVILFAGGSGKLKLWRRTRPLRLDRGNFLVRTRRMFAGHGFLTIVVDVPSDQRADGLIGFRHSADHRTDIAAVMRWMRKTANAPLWLIGTSRGTVSVAHLAASLPIDGAVLTAVVTEMSSRRPAMALDARLEDVTAPVLLVNHRDDDCRVSPSSNMGMVRQRLKKSAHVEIMIFTGGRNEDPNGCQAMTNHGFLGIEEKVVAAIAGWIKSGLRR